MLITAAPVQAAPAVQKVSVAIVSSEGTLPARVVKRMEASVATVGKHVFTGQEVSNIDNNLPGYENIVKDVIDRVLVGYSVQKVHIQPGETANINVTIEPYGDVVRDIRLEFDFGGLSTDLIRLVQQDMGTVEEDLAAVLVGLPVDALDWAGAVSKVVVREILSAQLPEFRSNFEIVSGSRTTVKITLLPQSPVVQDTKIVLRSRTIPNLLLLQVKPAAEKAAAMMNRLPVAFVQRHNGYFNSLVSAAVKDHRVAKNYGLILTPKVIAGEQTVIELNAETDKYRVALEGYVDVGKKEDGTTVKLHAGKFVSPRDELFTEVEFIPSSIAWKFYPGWSHKITPASYGGVKYSVSDKAFRIFLDQYVAPDWIIRAERTPKTGYYEFGVRYKIHDLLSAEYVVGKNDNWLRLIGHL